MNSSQLDILADDFKEELNRLFQRCFEIKPFAIDAEKTDEKVVIRTTSKTSLSSLKSIFIRIDYKCLLDRESKYLSIQSSNFHIFGQARQALFRFEYLKVTKTRSVPHAHLQIHAERGEISLLQASKEPALLSDIHFPLGGGLMRPSLEEILLMCDKEFHLQFKKDAVDTLRSSMQRYREKQALTIARNYKDLLVLNGWSAPIN